MSIDKKTMAALHSIAKETAKDICKRTAIPGWHEDESRFPESDYKDVLAMLEEAYRPWKNSVGTGCHPKA